MLITCQAFEQFFFIFFLHSALKGVHKAEGDIVFKQKNEAIFNFI